MPKRRPNSGKVLEESILPAITAGRYKVLRQYAVNLSAGIKPYVVDVICVLRDLRILVSCKWQDSSGTAFNFSPERVSPDS